MDRAYEDNKAIALAKTHGFHTVVHPKKNYKLPCLHDKQLYKQQNIIERYFFHLRCFRKVFTHHNKFDFIFILIISIFMLTLPQNKVIICLKHNKKDRIAGFFFKKTRQYSHKKPNRK